MSKETKAFSTLRKQEVTAPWWFEAEKEMLNFIPHRGLSTILSDLRLIVNSRICKYSVLLR